MHMYSIPTYIHTYIHTYIDTYMQVVQELQDCTVAYYKSLDMYMYSIHTHTHTHDIGGPRAPRLHCVML